MSLDFASIPLSNARLLCVGGITSIEAREAASDGLDVDGFGYYLFVAQADNPQAPIEILAKFFSQEQAERALGLFPAD